MNFQTKSKRESINWVLQELRPVSQAPRSITKCQGWEFACRDAKEVDKFIADRLAAERAKTYKAVDEFGNVWVVTNPWAWDEISVKGGECVRKLRRPAPRLAFTYEQALAESKICKPLPEAANAGGFYL